VNSLASPFFRRGIEGVANQQLNPLSPPLKKGEVKEAAINGCTLTRLMCIKDGYKGKV